MYCWGLCVSKKLSSCLCVCSGVYSQVSVWDCELCFVLGSVCVCKTVCTHTTVELFWGLLKKTVVVM